MEDATANKARQDIKPLFAFSSGYLSGALFAVVVLLVIQYV